MSTKIELAKSELTAISTQINLAHRECLLAMRSSMDHAIKAGDLLVQAKALISHGDWLKWVSNNCEFSERTARGYMRIAKNKTAIPADLTMTEALKMLAAPKPPIEIHELGKIFPMMSDKEIDLLAESIKRIGLIHPITLYEGKILDGKCRYEACKRAGVVPKFDIFPDDHQGYTGSALDFVLTNNLYRAHYSEDQRAVMALAIMEITSNGN